MIQRQRPQRQLNILPQLIFLTLTFVAAIGGTFVALQIFGRGDETSQIPQIITVEVIITATPLPTKLATAAASNQAGQVELPADIAAETGSGQSGAIDPNALGARGVALSTPTVSVAGGPVFNTACEFYSVLAGDSAYFIALRKNVELDDLLRVNGLTVDSAPNLQIGQRLLIPHAGCRVDQSTGEPVALAPAVTATPVIAATSTPVSANFELVSAEGLGDITAESLRLRNNGAAVNISGWSLADADGNSFTFHDMMIFPQAEVILYTRSGTATGDARFWGRQESVWSSGESLTLRDAQERLLQTLSLPAGDA